MKQMSRPWSVKCLHVTGLQTDSNWAPKTHSVIISPHDSIQKEIGFIPYQIGCTRDVNVHFIIVRFPYIVV